MAERLTIPTRLQCRAHSLEKRGGDRIGLTDSPPQDLYRSRIRIATFVEKFEVYGKKPPASFPEICAYGDLARSNNLGVEHDEPVLGVCGREEAANRKDETAPVRPGKPSRSYVELDSVIAFLEHEPRERRIGCRKSRGEKTHPLRVTPTRSSHAPRPQTAND